MAKRKESNSPDVRAQALQRCWRVVERIAREASERTLAEFCAAPTDEGVLVRALSWYVGGEVAAPRKRARKGDRQRRK